MRLRIAFASLALLTTPALGQEAVRIRIGGSPGQFNRYAGSMEMWMRAGPMAAMLSSDTTLPLTRINTFSTRTLTAVNADTLVFTEVIDSARFDSPAFPQMAQMAGPQAIAMMVGSSTVTRMTSTGKIYGVESVPGRGGAGMMGGRQMMGGNRQQGPIFGLPDRAVRVGESWSDSSVVQAEGMATSTLATYRLERVETRGSSRVAVISMNGTVAQQTPAGANRFSLTGEVQIDLGNSRLALITMNMSGTVSNPEMGGEVPMRMAMNQRLM